MQKVPVTNSNYHHLYTLEKWIYTLFRCLGTYPLPLSTSHHHDHVLYFKGWEKHQYLNILRKQAIDHRWFITTIFQKCYFQNPDAIEQCYVSVYLILFPLFLYTCTISNTNELADHLTRIINYLNAHKKIKFTFVFGAKLSVQNMRPFKC